MYALILILVLLLAFLLFVAWDRRRIERSILPRQALIDGFQPTALVKWRAWAGLALLFFVLGLAELNSPSEPPFTGPGSWFELLLYSSLGPYGVAIGYFGIFCMLVLASVRAVRTKD